MGWILYAVGVVGFIVFALLAVKEILLTVGRALQAI